ncbi:SET domain-containing protein-lysine N-methyltransferase [Patescibacteria group bacterium]|nr:SET domain-containing protein-lysine N-methyltransferase [Patescibacteria group bacterium]
MLRTQLPIPAEDNERIPKGLFAGRDHVKGDVVGPYFGKIRPANNGEDNTYAWDIGRGLVLDPANYSCVAKYANNSVVRVFPANCKMVNKNGKRMLVATRPINKGEEFFWCYGARYFAPGTKLTRATIIKLKDKIVWRDNYSKEIKDSLKYHAIVCIIVYHTCTLRNWIGVSRGFNFF